MRVLVDGPCISPDDSNARVIYRWHSSEGLRKVVQQTDPLPPTEGNSSPEGPPSSIMIFLETPTVDDQGRVAFTALRETFDRAMLVWEAGGGGPDTLTVVASVGDIVPNMVAHAVGGGTFNFAGTITTMATFDTRSAAAFHDGEVFFRAAGDGDILPVGDAIWLWSGATPTNISNGFQRMELGNPMNTAFWNSFPNLAIDRLGLTGVATVSQGAPRTITFFSPGDPTAHAVWARWYPPPGGFPEFDYRTNGMLFSVVAGVDDELNPLPGDEDTIGVWIGSTLSNHRLIGWEGQGGTTFLEEIFTVHVGAGGQIGLHGRYRTAATTREVIEEWDSVNGRTELLSQGDPLTVNGQNKVITGFMALGFGGPTFGPVVSGAGRDGHLSALNGQGKMALLILYENATSAGPQGPLTEVGAFSLNLSTDLIFADDFESADTSEWSAEVP